MSIAEKVLAGDTGADSGAAEAWKYISTHEYIRGQVASVVDDYEQLVQEYQATTGDKDYLERIARLGHETLLIDLLIKSDKPENIRKAADLNSLRVMEWLGKGLDGLESSEAFYYNGSEFHEYTINNLRRHIGRLATARGANTVVYPIDFRHPEDMKPFINSPEHVAQLPGIEGNLGNVSCIYTIGKDQISGVTFMAGPIQEAA